MQSFRLARECGNCPADQYAPQPAGREPPLRPAITSPSGDVVFQKVGMTKARELDRDAVIEVTHHPACCLADGDRCADLRTLVGLDRGTRLGNVDDAASDIDPVLQDEPGGGIARGDAAVAPVLGQAENVTVGYK
jgi:hypothetical protein